jgi:lichenan operon transcriptional antiterminator
MKPSDSYRSAAFVSEEMSSLVSQCLFRLSNQYDIPLMDQSLITRLSLHLQRLSVRSCTGLHKSSEALSSIKGTYPFLYNIALILCDHISHEYTLDLSQDEISYVVLHLGGHLTKTSALQKKIKCAVACPLYDNIKNHLISSLYRHFEDTLDITNIIGEMNTEEISPDTQLVISTFPLPDIPNMVIISPLLQREDLDNIQTKTSQLLNQMRNNEFCQLLMRFLNPNAFEMDIKFESPKEAIHHICQNLQRLKITDDTFEEKVYERENISPTGFENCIAIPHTNDYFAKQSVMYLIINRNSMDWSGSPVNLIFLVALAEKDQRDFYRLYNSLSLIFTNTDCRQALKKIRCFQDVVPAFMEILPS